MSERTHTRTTERIDFKATRRGGLYFSGENPPYLSVTRVLEVIDKPALRIWYGKQVWEAMIADPSLSWKEAARKPYEASDKAKSRGTTVHTIIEAAKGGQLELVTPEFQGYLDAFNRFVDDYSVEVMEHERTVYHEGQRYAGTLDLLANIKHHGRNTVVDIKTSKAIYPEYPLQVAAYREALHEQGIATDGAAVVLLRENGGYAFEFYPETGRQYRGFLAAKALYEAINEEELINIGYLGGGEE